MTKRDQRHKLVEIIANAAEMYSVARKNPGIEEELHEIIRMTNRMYAALEL
jgi:hypothetical protein